VAGMVHAITLLVIMLVAAPLAVHIPMACLAGMLVMVAWNMSEAHASSPYSEPTATTERCC
jgi:SulP family sulfate permease